MGQEPKHVTYPEIFALSELLKEEWPLRSAALRASGVPLMEGDDDPDPDPKPDPAPDPKPDSPPWGDDFDPERAWTLVTNLRGEVAKTKGERDQLRTKVQEHEDSTKSEKQLLEDRATTAEKTANEKTLELLRMRVALKKGLSETQAKRLVGTTEEELEADADELLASFKPDDDGEDPLRRPSERLRTGAVPRVEPEETDPHKLAAMVPRRF